jgi:hypothetical protein
MIPVPPDLEITITDIRLAGHCARVRGFFMQHGLYDEFKEMMKGGTISAEKLLATGDPRAVQVVQLKLERERADG